MGQNIEKMFVVMLGCWLQFTHWIFITFTKVCWCMYVCVHEHVNKYQGNPITSIDFNMLLCFYFPMLDMQKKREKKKTIWKTPQIIHFPPSGWLVFGNHKLLKFSVVEFQLQNKQKKNMNGTWSSFCEDFSTIVCGLFVVLNVL